MELAHENVAGLEDALRREEARESRHRGAVWDSDVPLLRQARSQEAEAVADELRAGLREEMGRREATAAQLKMHFEEEMRRVRADFESKIQVLQSDMGENFSRQLANENGEVLSQALTEAAESAEREREKFVESEVQKCLVEEKLALAEAQVTELQMKLAPFLEATGNFYLGSPVDSAYMYAEAAPPPATYV
jgi:hypothetical protein